MHILSEYVNVTTIVKSFGYVGVTILIFAESGFLLGFFLPGDSLLITAGLLSAGGYFNIWFMAGLAIVAAILGDNLGYVTGRKFGPTIFRKDESLFFKREYVTHTQNFFERYGRFAVVLARFTPIVRTFTPIMAGVGRMKYNTFLFFNILGGVLWSGGLLFLSYIAGSYIPNLNNYVNYIVVVVIIVSVIPVIKQYWKMKKGE